MAILEGDIKLMKSQRMTDNDDGGGRITGNEVQDGVSNDIFDDISDLDRTTGNVALRKVFPRVDTTNQDVYLGANVIVAEVPEDPNVSVTLFTTDNHDDDRLAAKDQVERYVVQGGRAQFYLLGNHFTNQRQLIVFQRTEVEIPTVGTVFMLQNDLGDQQFVRVTEVEEAVRTYSVIINTSIVDFERRRIVLGISAPLEFDFPGGDPFPSGSTETTLVGREISDVFETEVADAARYWGVMPLDLDANLSDVEVTVTDVLATLVPSAQSETPLIDADVYQSPGDVRPAAAPGVNISEDFEMVYTSANTASGYISRPAVRGSVVITLEGSAYSDNGDGRLLRTAGSAPFDELDIDYETGFIVGTRASGVSTPGTVLNNASNSATYQPGARFSGRRFADMVTIELANRGFNYVYTYADGKPRPGTMRVSVRILGEWYVLREIGNGTFVGEGTGTLNFTTGTLAITLNALPDVGSAIVIDYIIDEADELTEVTGAIPRNSAITKNVNKSIQPNTVTVTYTAGGVARTLTDDGSGLLTGDGEGAVNYGEGEVTFFPDQAPDAGTSAVIDFDELGANVYSISTPTIVAGAVVDTIPNVPIEPGSFSARYLRRVVQSGRRGRTLLYTIKVVDDGLGNLVQARISTRGGVYTYRTSDVVGTIDYASGDFSISINSSYTRSGTRISSYVDRGGFGWEDNERVYFRDSYSTNYTSEISGGMVVNYALAGATPTTDSETIPITEVQFQIGPEGDSTVIPGSVRFEWGGKVYIDREGDILTDFDPQTGAATAVGTIAYDGGIVTLTSWPAAAAPGVNVTAGVITNTEIVTDNIVHRTAGAPIRSQSYQITVTDEAGNIITQSADVDGLLDSPETAGAVNVEAGIVVVQFKDAADNPIWVLPDTARYNAVIVTSLPLDADIIGLNPVRLPADGRVPIYRPGDVVVVHNTQEDAFPNPASAGDVLTTRPRIASGWVQDATGEKLDPELYEIDNLTGDFTLATPLDLTGYTEPLTAVHRIEDMNLVSAVDISGRLSLTRPLSHAFTAGDSYVSTALVIGDMQGRVTNLFDQETWTEEWSDDLIGSEPAAEYNETDFPVEVDNRGALQQRWALVFTTNQQYNIIGETIGQIGTGSILSDTFPINPNTGTPYFTIRAAGWGTGWAAGNVLRFNTIGAAYPLWLARTVLQSDPTVLQDTFKIQIRGNVNA